MQHFKWIWNFDVLCTAKILLFFLNFTTGFQSFAEKQQKYGLENHKIYFKQNPVNTLKLEELTEKLAESCSVEEIGFGKG